MFISTNGGEDWFKFTEGVPTVSVMDMAIQQRESDLVLGTHGRSIFVLDDYSALRGLNAAAFNQRLAILNTTAGQQYDANQTPSTRFTGSGEFRAENEPYGVMITFMASGDDLPHPDKDAERARSISQRSEKPAEQDQEKDSVPKVEMTIRDTSGKVIRTKTLEVHQGVNRIAWGMERDGVRPMPGPEPPELEDGLPGGAQVPAGEYEVTLSLALKDADPATTNEYVTVLPDPRSEFSAQERLRRLPGHARHPGHAGSRGNAVERIVHAQVDIATTQALIEKKRKPGTDEDESLKELDERAGEIQKALLELEKRFRTPPGTKGIIFGDDQVSSKIGMARRYVGSTADAPRRTQPKSTLTWRGSRWMMQSRQSIITWAVNSRHLADHCQMLESGLFTSAIQP